MSILFYKVVHILGIILVFTAFGGLAVVGQLADPKPLRKILSILHGVGMLLLLVAGFGLIAKLGGGFPGWMIVKIFIWVLLGGVVVILKRAPDLGKGMLIALPVLGLVAGILAIYKPI